MPQAKSRGQRRWFDPDEALQKRVARELAKRLSPETIERLRTLSLAERAELASMIEAVVERLDPARGAA